MFAFARRAAGRGMLMRFRRNQDGATAVEFALVAAPFFALMFAIIETALLFFADQTFDTAVSSAARLIRTGQAQEAGMSASDFKAAICNPDLAQDRSGLGALFDCSKIKIDVKTYSNFSDISLTPPIDPTTKELNVTENYQPGVGGNIVVVRAYYEWPTFVPGLGNNLADMPDGTHLLVATAAFRNEPFPTSTP
jgi:Flp pilus assembly protein TadG